MAPLRLSMAMWDYDRVKALEDGRARIEGVDLNFLNLRVEETFMRQLRHHEFDIAEMSLSSYVMTLHLEKPPFVALPVFPVRIFRHQSIYVSKKANIKSPADLRGKRAACPEWQMTAPVWERGIIEDDYGVRPDEMEWFCGAMEPSAEVRTEKLKLDLPFKMTPIKQGQCLAQMLADGEIDVLFTATMPSTYRTSDNVTELFEDYVAVEKGEWMYLQASNYLKRTGILPIMHLVVVKTEIIEANPWLARSITKAFAEALEYSYSAMHERGAPHYMLPWLKNHVAETEAAFGSNRWWKDGLKENYHVLAKFLEYSHKQHMAKRLYKPEELFVPSASETFVI